MIPLLVALTVIWVSASIGRVLLAPFGKLPLAPSEQVVYGSALGLGLLAYGVLALGLAGWLQTSAVSAWITALALAGITGMVANGRDALAGARHFVSTLADRRTWPARGLGVIICLSLAVSLLACFLPPTGHQWDALAYHLADPKVFLADHRIHVLPTEHHSNFPFTMEMLYTVGLMYGGGSGYAAANLIHWWTLVLCVVALLAFGDRLECPLAGRLAAMLLVTTPLVMWEASVAYIDVASALYTTLPALAAVALTCEVRRNEAPFDDQARLWCLLAGLTMGLALGVKYLALVPLALVGAMLLAQRAGVRNVARYAVVAVVVGSPWYLKSAVLMGNPVYPYFYKLFPHSRYWSADRAATYQSEQSGFGGHRANLAAPAQAARDLALAPLRLVTQPQFFANQGDYTFSTLIGGLYAGAAFALAFLPPVPRAIRLLLLYAIGQFVVWFLQMQFHRYLIQLLPSLALVAGYTLARILSAVPAGAPAPGARIAARWTAAAALACHVAIVAWSLFALPTTAAGAAETGLLPTALSLPEVWSAASDPQARQEMLHRRLDVYAADEWINQNAPQSAGVILYEDVRGFYLDRPYLWGDAPHSNYIPYATMRTGQDLTAWLHQHGIRYALIDLNFSPNNGSDPALPHGPSGNEQTALDRWYTHRPEPAGSWRAILDDALAHGDWQPVFMQHGVIVLDTGSAQ